MVIDDGVAARLAEDHFYVTATTGGVDKTHREMLRWNAQWRLSVDIANVTAAFSAINIAGPNSRAVLEALGCSSISVPTLSLISVAERVMLLVCPRASCGSGL